MLDVPDESVSGESPGVAGMARSRRVGVAGETGFGFVNPKNPPIPVPDFAGLEWASRASRSKVGILAMGDRIEVEGTRTDRM